MQGIKGPGSRGQGLDVQTLTHVSFSRACVIDYALRMQNTRTSSPPFVLCSSSRKRKRTKETENDFGSAFRLSIKYFHIVIKRKRTWKIKHKISKTKVCEFPIFTLSSNSKIGSYKHGPLEKMFNNEKFNFGVHSNRNEKSYEHTIQEHRQKLVNVKIKKQKISKSIVEWLVQNPAIFSSWREFPFSYIFHVLKIYTLHHFSECFIEHII